MKKVSYIMLVLLCACLLAAECDDGGSSASPDNPKSVCDYLFDHCGSSFYNEDMADCTQALSSLEKCRFECVLDTKDCEIMHDCLFYGLNDTTVSQYCTMDGQSTNNGNGGSGDTFEECAESKCKSQNDACKANSDCVAIYEDCYPACNDGDLECIAVCALDYLGGIEAHDALYACLQQNCS